eukprot:Pgem_evm2s5668
MLDNKTLCSMFAFNLVNGELTVNTDIIEHVEYCKSLDLSNYGITSFADNVFSSFMSLTHLDLSLNNITNLPV